MMKPAFAMMVVLCAGLALAADLTGTWKATMPGQDGEEVKILFHLKQDGEKLTGKVEGPAGQLEISEGSVNGDTVTFTVTMNDMKIVHKGTVSGDEMKLKVEIGDQSMEMTAKREP